MLVAERDDVGLEAVRGVVAEQLEQALAQLVDVELAGVDDDVGLAPQRLEGGALALDGLGHEVALGPRVAPAGVLEPAHEHVVGRLEEQDTHAGIRGPQPGQVGGDLGQVAAGADDEGHAFGRRAGRLGQVGHLHDQRRRQVVDDEPAEVLERVGRLRRTCAGEPGDDQEVDHVTNPGYRRASSSRDLLGAHE